MPKAEITYKPVGVNERATHGDYKHLCQMWEGLTVGTAKIWATEMREHPDFKQFIDNPTHIRLFLLTTKDFAYLLNGKPAIGIALKRKH